MPRKLVRMPLDPYICRRYANVVQNTQSFSMRFSFNIASKSVSKVTRFGICSNNRAQLPPTGPVGRGQLPFCPCDDEAFSARPPGLNGEHPREAYPYHRHRHGQPGASHHTGDQRDERRRRGLPAGQGRRQGRARRDPAGYLRTLYHAAGWQDFRIRGAAKADGRQDLCAERRYRTARSPASMES